MATNYVKGNVETTLYTPGSAVSAGAVVRLASTTSKKGRIGVALSDIAASTPGAVAITGCFTLAKLSAAVIAQGESVSWDYSGLVVDDNAMTAASGDIVEFGMADAAAGAGTTTVNVWIDQPGTYTA